MRCVECGRENPEHFSFCAQCGRSLVPGVEAKAAGAEERICGSCGRRNPAIFRFCGACGTPLAQPVGAVALKCADCGRQNPPHFRFCAGCGRELAVVEAAASAVVESATAGESALQRGEVTEAKTATAPEGELSPADAPTLAVRSAAAEQPKPAVFVPPFLEVAAVSAETVTEEAPAAQEMRPKVEAPSAEMIPTAAPEPAPVEVSRSLTPSVLGLGDPQASSEGSYLLEEEKRGGRGWMWAAAAALLVAAGVGGWWAVGHYGGARQQVQVAAPAPPVRMNLPTPTNEPGPSSIPGSGVASEPPSQAANSGQAGAIPQPPVGAGATVGAGPGPAAASAGVSPKPAPGAIQRPAEAATDAMAKSRSGSGVVAGRPAGTQPLPTGPVPGADSAVEDSRTIKGEQYLYGQGVAPDCAVAVDNLKAAADDASVRAQSIMGAMYATGHCMPRDVVLSYQYFARVLVRQPWNASVKKNMETLWDEMSDEQRRKVK